MSPAAEGVIERLDATRQRWWLFSFFSTITIAVSASLALLLAFMALDAVWRLSQSLLWTLFAAWLAASLALTLSIARRLMRGQRSLEATARRVESAYPELGSALINIVQLADGATPAPAGFREAALRAAAAEIGPLSFDAAAARLSRWQRLRYCLQLPRDLAEAMVVFLLVVAVAVALQWRVPNWGSAAARLLTPWEFVPSIGSLGPITVTPGNADVLLGGDLEIAGELQMPPAAVPRAALLIRFGDEGEQSRPLAIDASGRRFALTLPGITRPFRYRLEVGDSQTPVYRVEVQAKPAIERVEVVVHEPAYLGGSERTISQESADFEAPQYAEVDLRFHASTPLAMGTLQAGGEQRSGTLDPTGAVLGIDGLVLLNDTNYTLRLTTQGGLTDPDPRVNHIHVVADQRPTIELLKPPRRSVAAPGATIPVLVRASDDHGLSAVRLEIRMATDADESGAAPPATDAPPSEAASENASPTKTIPLSDAANATNLLRQLPLALDAAEYRAGQTLWLRAVAIDNRRYDRRGRNDAPQQAASGWHAIRLIPAEEHAAATIEAFDALRGALLKLIERQVQTRLATGAIAAAPSDADLAARAGRVRDEQTAIQQSTAAMARPAAENESDANRTIRRLLGQLAANEMIEAVTLSEDLCRAAATPGNTPAADSAAPGEPIVGAAGPLTKTQDAIIAALRRVLQAVREAEAAALGDETARRGGDLPSDAQKALTDAVQRLDEFLQQQRKVIEASENLAKTPVDDFSEKDEQLLKGLAASEDDWSRFMQELNTDLSKLPEQDFSNPAGLKEIVEIQTELQMAEDALLKKTVDIAVPLEQLGYERAEELKTNLEKWLPDDPDRERWSQEESLSDADKEAPMAELPGELEDLVGELMEDEEDLFDEMEDVSSSAADSLDAGAGWEVSDGPISNMSAKGATGNRLPNTSEIGGRAGEGRSGKSSGEFVGEEAVGKGGRKTPSRLTPDPYVQGQIADHSQEETGGATGGGKESGQGSRGLEGPAPRQPGPRELERLAGKQASLRNKAEGIDLKFQILNYHRADLQKLIDAMAQVERDLRAGRYQNALRARQVTLNGVEHLKQYVDGEFAVRQDTSTNLPSDVQKEMLDAAQEPSPAGWEDVNRQYFERLSQGAEE